MKDWFAVSTEGLKELQSGKSKSFIVRELIQNAWDENITACSVYLEYKQCKSFIKIVDDNPEGFKDLTDSFTLFKHTSKRENSTQRGRFNIGEKQAFCLCDYVKIVTTKGSVTFDKKNGRQHHKEKTNCGTIVEIELKCTIDEFNEIQNDIALYISPKNIVFTLNGCELHKKILYTSFSASLKTEILENQILRKVNRKTTIDLYTHDDNLVSYIYEMGIPVCETDCKYHVDIQQKVPLSIDRDTIPESYLKNLFAEILNNCSSTIENNEASAMWIRQGMSDSRVESSTVKTILTKRFGDKVCVANPFDKNSIDEAIANGYNVVHGSEMSKDEWDNSRSVMQSSTELFGKSLVSSKSVQETLQMKYIRNITVKIAQAILGIKVNVEFIASEGASTIADYGSRTVRFNVSRCPSCFFMGKISKELLDVIIHELGHEYGKHTEMSYHEALTNISSKLILKVIDDIKFFERF